MFVGGTFVLILVGAGAVQFLLPQPSGEPLFPADGGATTTAPAETELPRPQDKDVSTAPPRVDSPRFSIARGDEIASWDFTGVYTGSAELEAKARAEIERLSAILATATSSAMITAVSIANQHELLGDGQKQYEYLERAMRADPTNALPWHNLGVLMARLGALETARAAYEKATLLLPGFKVYHYAYLEFLTTHMKNDAVRIEKAFAFAEENIGQTAYLTELRAEWRTP